MVRGILTIHSVTRPWVAVATVIPAAVLAAFELTMLMFGLFGNHPLWRSETLNLSEAAALRDAAELARLIELGADPNMSRPVRAGFLDSQPHDVTPLEAVTYSNRPELVRLLMSGGVKLDEPTWIRLRCYARNSGLDDVAVELDAWRPSGVTLECSGSESLW